MSAVPDKPFTHRKKKKPPKLDSFPSAVLAVGRRFRVECQSHGASGRLIAHGGSLSYNVSSILARIQPYDQYLVPESIILVGRQGHHKRALHLLTHGLGDYHTAINYCMLGGASIFHPAMASAVGSAPPDQEEQRKLFSTLLHEFLTLKDEGQRKEQVSELLARFDGWFELEDVLPLIPEEWPLGCIEGFLVGAIRRLVQERAETMIVKALSGAENVIVANEFAEKSQDRAPVLVTVEDQVV